MLAVCLCPPNIFIFYAVHVVSKESRRLVFRELLVSNLIFDIPYDSHNKQRLFP
jgi:hypothetical protein